MEGSSPTGLVEEVDEFVKSEAGLFRGTLFVHLIFRGFEGPINEEGASDEVAARD